MEKTEQTTEGATSQGRRQCPFSLAVRVRGMELRLQGWRGLMAFMAIAVTAIALMQELQQPPTERKWHGYVFGCVPYDFRWPTWARLRQAFWDRGDPRLFTERPFGVGWSINFASLLSGAVKKKQR